MELQPEWVYELDSSHAGKFSRHLIIRIPGRAFANNLAVGHLVSQILAEPEVGLKYHPKQLCLAGLLCMKLMHEAGISS